MYKPTVFLAVGQQFDRLTVIDPEVRTDQGKRGARCMCTCGAAVVVQITNLRAGRVRSCGCLKAELAAARSKHAAAVHASHRLTSHPLYQTWYHMIARCENPGHKYYRYYGGRGITVCPRWHDIRAFIEDVEHILGPRPEGMTLDRRRNGLGYKPSNVRWASWREQARNRRSGWTPERRAAHSARLLELHASGAYAKSA